MKILTGNEEKEAIGYFHIARDIAKQATCLRDKCGSVIVKDGEVIGKGFNSPPAGMEEQRRCNADKNKYHEKVKDKTCCVHAEQSAIYDALAKNSDKITGSIIFFTRVDENGEIIPSGEPYCTICSKASLHVGISEFVLWKEEGIKAYTTAEYNKISYEYGK